MQTSKMTLKGKNTSLYTLNGIDTGVRGQQFFLN